MSEWSPSINGLLCPSASVRLSKLLGAPAQTDGERREGLVGTGKQADRPTAVLGEEVGQSVDCRVAAEFIFLDRIINWNGPTQLGLECIRPGGKYFRCHHFIKSEVLRIVWREKPSSEEHLHQHSGENQSACLTCCAQKKRGAYYFPSLHLMIPDPPYEIWNLC